MRLIDADALKAWFFRPYSNEERYSNMDVAQAIDHASTIEAEQTILELSNLLAEKDKIIKELSQIRTDIEAEPIKHGEWIIDKSGSLMCSKCGTLLDDEQKPSRYCPNCGAKMDEVEE